MFFVVKSASFDLNRYYIRWHVLIFCWCCWYPLCCIISWLIN